MQARPRSIFFPSISLFLAITSPVFAQTPSPEKPASLELGAAVAGTLVWGEDDMGVAVNVVIHNKTGQDTRNIVTTPALFSSPDASAKAGEILQDGCPLRLTADMKANGQSLAQNGTKQIRFVSQTDVEELGPDVDATPVLLVCASYKLAGMDENHTSAVLYRVLHMDPARGLRPIDRVTGDIPAQSLKLEELGRFAK